MHQDELEQRLWKSLMSDRTVMLGLAGVDDGHMRPMTAQIEEPRAPIWFFTSAENRLLGLLGAGSGNSIATFASKDHAIFASLHGALREDTDRAVVDRLWNPFVAAWYEGGKDDPNLRLLRLDAEHAKVWENESSFLAGVKLLLGIDPKQSYADKIADVDLR